MTGFTWQRVITIGLFLATGVTALAMHENTLAATLVGLAGGMALPPMSGSGGAFLSASSSNGNGGSNDGKKGGTS